MTFDVFVMLFQLRVISVSGKGILHCLPTRHADICASTLYAERTSAVTREYPVNILFNIRIGIRCYGEPEHIQANAEPWHNLQYSPYCPSKSRGLRYPQGPSHGLTTTDELAF